jgi:hypothetical protein
MSSAPFTLNQDDTKSIQNDVRELLQAMPDDFREHLMHSFLWKQDTLEAYLNRDATLEGDRLKDAYSHLESLLARIESFACDDQTQPFPSYDEWVTTEYLEYKAARREDKEDIERLIDEGGVTVPAEKPAPVDTMANDSLAFYNHLKEEAEKKAQRGREATTLMQSPQYQNLQRQADKMCKVIMHSIYK